MEIASDKLTEGGSSHLIKATEPMEISSAIASTLPTKRKAESDPAKEIIEENDDENEEIYDEDEECSDEDEECSDEDEECSDESEEMDSATKDRRWVEETNAYYASLWIAPQWDVDSFENLKFDEEEEKERTDGLDQKDLQDWLSFRRQLIENKGFYVDPKLWPMYKYSEHRVIKDLEESISLGRTYRDLLNEISCLCLQRFNQEEKLKDEKFINVEFIKVVGAVYKPARKQKYYITFMAKEKPDGPDVEYQAKVWSEFVNGRRTNYPILCRRAPPPKTS